ncbi:hypothetical protein EG832_10815 [bacterium]|nr:hypothetical protein [bacterium]
MKAYSIKFVSAVPSSSTPDIVLDTPSGQMIGRAVFVKRRNALMQQTRIKTVIFLSLLGFFLGVVALSFHHHDNTIFRPACAICKVKTSLSGTFNKVKIDTSPAVPSLFFSFAAITLGLSGIAPNGKTIFIDSQIVKIYPNKAPPLTF